MKYTHACLKCRAAYDDDDPEAFYCEPCNIDRKAIAAEVDRKIAARGPRRPTMSALQEYEAAPKVNGRFIRVSL